MIPSYFDHVRIQNGCYMVFAWCTLKFASNNYIIIIENSQIYALDSAKKKHF